VAAAAAAAAVAAAAADAEANLGHIRHLSFLLFTAGLTLN
jgi:hypothetical protein